MSTAEGLVVLPEQLRGVAVPVTAAARAVAALSTSVCASGDTGAPVLDIAVADLVLAWTRGLRLRADALQALGARLDGAAETYEAVEALVAGWSGR